MSVKITEPQWRYEIQYGPDGEANYAWIYKGDFMVATMRTHHAQEIVAALSAHTAETIEPAAEDWAVVPREPSTEMWMAWDDAYRNAPQGYGAALAWESAYAAMLEAAPPAPRDDLVAEVERLRAALEPFKSGGNWGRYKAWLTCGPPTQADGVRAAKQITEWQVAVDRAALLEGRTDA